MRLIKVGATLLMLAMATAVSAQELTFVTADDMAPWSMEKGDKKGIAVEVMNALAKQTGVTLKIQFEPWGRAKQIATEGKNIVIMPLIRSPEQEKNYTWLGTLKTVETHFVTTTGKSYDLESAKALGSVLVSPGTPMVKFLENAGFKNLDKVGESTVQVKKLAMGRADAWYIPDINAKWIWKSQNIQNTMTNGPSISKQETYLGMSPGADPALAKKLGDALEAMKKDGTLDRIIDSYTK